MEEEKTLDGDIELHKPCIVALLERSARMQAWAATYMDQGMKGLIYTEKRC
jgi:hypothetical protein